MIPAGYPDVEARLVAWLKAGLYAGNVIEGGPTDLPPNLTFALPLVTVERFGGADDVPSLDRASVDVDVYTADRTSAKALAERIRRAIRIALPGQILDGAVITRVDTVSAPTVLAFDNHHVYRVGATYRLTVHHPI